MCLLHTWFLDFSEILSDFYLSFSSLISHFKFFCHYYAFTVHVFSPYLWDMMDLIFGRPLFASSLLSIIQILLDQTRQDDIRIIGCHALFDFVNCQVSLKAQLLYEYGSSYSRYRYWKWLKIMLLLFTHSRWMVLINLTLKPWFQDSVSYLKRWGRMSYHAFYVQRACRPLLLW